MTELNVFIAFLAGLVSFLSPCVLPLVPSYLSFISGSSYRELSESTAPRRTLVVRTLAFVAGFSLVFVVLGLLFSGPALLMSGATRWINIIAGTVVVLLGLNMVFDWVQSLNIERRFHVRSRPAGAAGSVVAGMAFGAGWSPCIGPILASILFLAGTEQSTGRAALLLAVYSLGLGTPFLMTALAFTHVRRWMERIKPHLHTIRVGSGLFLIGIGLLIASGRFQQINGLLTSAGSSLERWATTRPGAADLVLGGGALALAAIQPLAAYLGGKRLIRPVGTSVSVVLAAVGLLEIFGVVNIGPALGAWLRFQGV